MKPIFWSIQLCLLVGTILLFEPNTRSQVPKDVTCPACKRATGELKATKLYSYEPGNSFFHSNTGGIYRGWLKGPAETDFDLYLFRWSENNAWELAARSDGPDSSEHVSYRGREGYYIWMIIAYSGEGKYEFSSLNPTREELARPDTAKQERWVAHAPEGGLEIEGSGNPARVNVRLTFPNGGYRVVDWGEPVKSGDFTFSVDSRTEKWTGQSIQVITEKSHYYDLGTLPAGTYRFNFLANGTLIGSETFVIN